MILGKCSLALAVAIGIAVGFVRRRGDHHRNTHQSSTHEGAQRTICFPVFAGDRFGDDWGRV